MTDRGRRSIIPVGLSADSDRTLPSVSSPSVPTRMRSAHLRKNLLPTSLAGVPVGCLAGDLTGTFRTDIPQNSTRRPIDLYDLRVRLKNGLEMRERQILARILMDISKIFLWENLTGQGELEIPYGGPAVSPTRAERFASAKVGTAFRGPSTADARRGKIDTRPAHRFSLASLSCGGSPSAPLLASEAPRTGRGAETLNLSYYEVGQDLFRILQDRQIR